MNQREHLKVFLEDGRVPLETNTVERGIRPMAVLRKNQGFVQSIDGAKTLAMCMSLAETAKLNGIDVEEWLNDMSKAAFKHAYEKQWTYWYTNEEAPKNPNRKIQDWANMAELLSDFNWAESGRLGRKRRPGCRRNWRSRPHRRWPDRTAPPYGSSAGDEFSAPFFLGPPCDGRVSAITCFAPIVKLQPNKVTRLAYKAIVVEYPVCIE